MKIVATKGSGPVLNVLHGWGMNAHLLDHWADHLAKTHQVNLIDLPGHGLNQDQALSMDLAVLADQAAALPRGGWLGWSMGGMLALNLALNHPDRVDALVMLCATPCFVTRTHWPHGTDVQVLQQFGDSLQQDVRKTIQTFLALEVMGVEDERSQLRELKQLVFERPLPDLGSLQAGLTLLKEVDLSSQLNSLQMPSLWISGRRDRLVLPAAMEMAAKAAGGEHQMLRGSGHAPFIRQTEVLTQIIQDFL